jgi:hypothetical protein
MKSSESIMQPTLTPFQCPSDNVILLEFEEGKQKATPFSPRKDRISIMSKR